MTESDNNMHADNVMVFRMSGTCQKKCVPARYKDAELNKGEAVCLDRCVAKYMDIHDRIGKKLTSISMQDEETMKKIQSQIPQPPSK